MITILNIYFMSHKPFSFRQYKVIYLVSTIFYKHITHVPPPKGEKNDIIYFDSFA